MRNTKGAPASIDRHVRPGIDNRPTMLAARQTAAPRNKDLQVVVGFVGVVGVVGVVDVVGVVVFCTLRAA